jgi:hypothetical protein
VIPPTVCTYGLDRWMVVSAVPIYSLYIGVEHLQRSHCRKDDGASVMQAYTRRKPRD